MKSPGKHGYVNYPPNKNKKIAKWYKILTIQKNYRFQKWEIHLVNLFTLLIPLQEQQQKIANWYEEKSSEKHTESLQSI